MSVLDAPALVEPAYLWVPEHHHSYGPDVGDFADSIGMTPDPEERMAFDIAYAVDKSGKRVCFEFCLICARQNMKTHFLQSCSLADSYMFKRPLGIWTAHLFDTAQEAFRDLDNIISGTPWLADRVLRVSRANGDEGFEFKNGSRLKFKARSKTGGRGLTGDDVNMDEAFALSPSEMGALLPTLSARPDPQVRLTSSAGLEGSAILRGVRDRGRAGNDPSLGYMEFCAPEQSCREQDCDHTLSARGCALDDAEMWRKANPALDRRITREHIASERRALSMDPEEFARERLGWWSQPGGADLAYPYADWLRLTDPSSTMTSDDPVFLVDTNPIRSRTAIVVAGGRDDGLIHVELAKFEAGTSWVTVACQKLRHDFPNGTFAMLADGAAASLIPELEKADITVDLLDSKAYVAACGSMFDAIQSESFRHIGQEPLDDAVTQAKKRQLEGAWALARKGGDISPIVAAVAARHLYAARLESAPLIAYR